jgi:hypothetical protein
MGMADVRSQLASEISKELLGPRHGPNENMSQNPSKEYLIGVLEPKDSTRGDFTYYSSADLRAEETETEEEGEVEKEEVNIGLQLGLPKTMGISFLVRGDPPTISFCATWARYKLENAKWQRFPNFYIQEHINATQPREWPASNDSIKFVLRSNPTHEGAWHVSLYCINETPLKNREIVRTEDLVFQPQLRIIREKDTEILPMLTGQLQDEEEASLSLLYRNRYGKARGHMCSAIWKEIDPERPWKENEEDAKSTKSHPFTWVDASLIKDPLRTEFSRPDLRTEFVPCYSIEQRPLSELHSSKPFDASILAEAWDNDSLMTFLKPLLTEYDSWIVGQKELVNTLPAEYQSTARRHVELCEDAKKRIEEGITVLHDNDEARLSFCFMNQAMHLQSTWKAIPKPLVWRPFQIAFILQCIPSIVNEKHPDRNVCDLLWFPTGGGKTEAYLGLAVFTLAYRRRARHNEPDAGAGTTVISRYTLRLLTIQQFRRALHPVLACDLLRVKNWHPKDYKTKHSDLWGKARFSIGLWVGGDVTPNRLLDRSFWNALYKRQIFSLGATGLLRPRELYKYHKVVVPSKGDPAQILNCPACDSILAVTPTNMPPDEVHEMHWLISSPDDPTLPISSLKNSLFKIEDQPRITHLKAEKYHVVSVRFSSKTRILPEQVDKWWNEQIKPTISVKCNEEFAKPSLPGYFIRKGGVYGTPVDFEIHCLNPKCPLNRIEWFECPPGLSEVKEEMILKPFRIPDKEGFGYGVPISAYVVDDQVYHRCPSIVIATVDKFARLSFEPRAAAIFGYVDRLDDCWGYFRECAPPDRGSLDPGETKTVVRFKQPELIIQDELHLIEGPLGTMTGLYETVIDLLGTQFNEDVPVKPKYIASSATIRRARTQISAIFARKTTQFPPQGVFIEDSFFSQMQEPHPLDSSRPGRLYIGICAPGKGPHTPIIRIWSALLQQAYRVRNSRGPRDPEADQFWTLVGFFNAIRELATTTSLYKQDIVEWLDVIGKRRGEPPRQLSRLEMELSSRMSSAEIPGILNDLARFPNNTVDAVFATSMFGTGVDVDRLGLMVVHGQPKTTATYIQATGRVGRQMGGLVVTFYRATRPRDLDHFEFFAGYHRSLARYVEAITVYPFSPRARERALGPIAVAMLRNAENIGGVPINQDWAVENDPEIPSKAKIEVGPMKMRTQRRSKEVEAVLDLLEDRSQTQPDRIRPPVDVCFNEACSEMDKWKSDSSKEELAYYEYAMTREPKYAVVLGDPQHKSSKKTVVFENAPQSLREVEATATFGGQ